MSTKALVLALVGTGCVVAAGAGGYLAVRMSSGDRAEGATLTSRPDPAATSAPASPADVPAETPAVTPAHQPIVKNSSTPAAPARTESRAPQAAPATAEASASATPPATTAAPPDPPVTDPATTPPPVTDTAPAQEPAKVKFEELTLKEDSVIGIRLDSPISSETAKVEDKVVARVSRDVTMNGHTAIPAGSRLEGVVTLVERGGKFKNASRLGIRFNSLVLGDNTRVAIQTEALMREGTSPANEATAKVGASAVIGGLIGGLIGGKKGAVVGATTGAAGGSAAVAAGDRNDVTLPAGSALTVKLTAPVTLLIERQE